MSSLVDSWPSLLALLKDSVPLGLPAPGQFLILGLVSLPLFFSLCTVVQVSLFVLLYLNASVVWLLVGHSQLNGHSVSQSVETKPSSTSTLYS